MNERLSAVQSVYHPPSDSPKGRGHRVVKKVVREDFLEGDCNLEKSNSQSTSKAPSQVSNYFCLHRTRYLYVYFVKYILNAKPVRYSLSQIILCVSLYVSTLGKNIVYIICTVNLLCCDVVTISQ